MPYICGTVTNIEKHSKLNTTTSDGKTKTTTSYIHAIDVDSKGYEFISDKPANISIGHKISAKQSIFGRRLNSIHNCNNDTYAGQSPIFWFGIFALMVVGTFLIFVFPKPVMPSALFHTYHLAGRDIPILFVAMIILAITMIAILSQGIKTYRVKKRLRAMCMLSA